MSPRIQRLLERKERIRNRMWKILPGTASVGERFFYSTLRVATLTLLGIKENRLMNRAAALSFSSLIGLIPMSAIMILVSGFALEKTDPDLVVNNIYKGISYIAPQLANLEEMSEEEAIEGEPAKAQLKVYLQEFVKASQSSAVGIGGTIFLILIVIQLFSSIEGALNDIWGVKKGRSWITRVGIYWTVITLGTVLAGAGIAMLATQVLKWNSITETLPAGESISALIGVVARLGSFLLLSTVLATFYRFIPNTLVSWRASFIGAFFALSIIGGNNAAAFLFSNRVALERSLYGSLAIIPVLMLGMYVFWFIILLGGRVTYAVQNARFKSDNMVWDRLSHASRESICLLLFSKICRRFRDCLPALSGRELAERSTLPVQFVNAGLSRLCDMGLLSSMPSERGEPYQNYKYQPAKPLDRIELNAFKTLFDNHGSTPDEELFAGLDPIVERFHETLGQARKSAFSDLTIEDIIELTKESDKSSPPAPSIESDAPQQIS